MHTACKSLLIASAGWLGIKLAENELINNKAAAGVLTDDILKTPAS